MKKNIPFQNLAASQLKEVSQEGIRLNGRMEDGATVISACFTVHMLKDKLETLLSQELEALAAQVYEHNGIIGHIKASTEIHSMQMYSITDTILHVKNGECDTITVTFAFILYFIGVDMATEWTRQIIERILV